MLYSDKMTTNMPNTVIFEVRRIKIKQKEIDQDNVFKMFENLKPKVHRANENELTSLK